MKLRIPVIGISVVAMAGSGCGGHAATPPSPELASAARPVLAAELRGGDTVAGDSFGFAMAGSGSTLLVGAPDHDRQVGRAYVFVGSREGWRQAAELAGSGVGPGGQFGGSVAISGGTAVVAAGGFGASAQAGGQGTGRVFVFGRTSNGWKQTAVLAGAGAFPGDGFGGSVAIAGNTILVGSDGYDNGAGRVFAYTRISGRWALSAVFGGAGTARRPLALFGNNVAMSGNEALITAPGAGSAYLYVRARTATGWLLAGALGVPKAGGGLVTGAISGRVVAAGVSSVQQGPVQSSGRVALFAAGPPRWHLQDELSVPGSDQSSFGSSVGVTGQVIAASSQGAADATGRVYLFARIRQRWRRVAELAVPSGGGQFGAAIAAWPGILAVAATGNGGSVYVFAF